MALSSGDRLDHYLISAPLGAGGMGEVYRARDTRLNRDVAIKVLPNEVSTDPERLARFEREAKVLASLNHPNIATLYGIETVVESGPESSPGLQSSDTPPFLVMELVEGDDLEQRIAAGPVPVESAVAIGRQIAEGLEAAHIKGVVHRDLKPANIRITSDGTVKVLDFGLAKAWEQPNDAEDSANSPTITAEMTREGTILGTAPYLSPEQARGHAVDPRTDIWALGCVLYEMLTGQRAFAGNTSTEIMARILERDPDWSALASTVPPALRRLIGRCLEKEPKRRLRDAGDVALALEDLDFERAPAPADDDRSRPGLFMKILPWVAFAVTAALAITGWLGWNSSGTPESSSPLHFTQQSPALLDSTKIGHYGPAVAISPDGHILAWVGATDSGTQLFARHLDEDGVNSIPGTEGGMAPFFSPDGEWIGFWAAEKLKKVSVRGGLPQTICETSHIHGASWADGIIVMGAIGDGSLFRVDPGGGQVQRIEISNHPGYQGGYPRLLPDAGTVLVSSQGRNTVDLLVLDTGEITTLVTEGTNGSYLPSGHLVWTQRDNLVAAPFDLSSRTITGEAHTVVEGVLSLTHASIVSQYAVSDEGTLVYLPGRFEQSGARPAWAKPDGTLEPLPLPIDIYLSPRISPDGRKLLFSRQAEDRNLWIAEPGRGVITPFTGDEGSEYWAIWTSDGTDVVFNSQQGDQPANLWMQPVDRSTPPRRLTSGLAHQPPQDITRDGRTVLFASAFEVTDDADIHLLHLDGEPTTVPLLETDANEIQPALSENERWVAYASDVTGNYEVYVQRFPDLGATVRVSPNGGQEPKWSPSENRLYYRSMDGDALFAVDFTGDDPLEFGTAELLFEGDFDPGLRWGSKWDIHPDGDRFLVLQIEHPEPPDGIRVIVNWFSELERLVPGNDSDP